MTSTNLLGQHPDHAAVRSGPQHRRRGPGRAVGDRRGRRPAAEEPADAAHATASQSGRRADPDPCGALRRAAGDDGRRLRREHPRAADLADPRHRPGGIGGQQKPAVRVQIDPVKLAALGLQLEDVAASSRTATVDAPKGSINGPQRSLDDLRQRPAAQGRALERRRGRLQERRAGAHPRYRRCGRRAGEQPADGLAERPRRHPAAGLQAAGRQRHRDGERRCRSCCRTRSPRCRRRSRSKVIEPHHDHQGLAARRGIHAGADHRAGRDGDIPVPAQRLGHHHSRASPCPWRCSAPRR